MFVVTVATLAAAVAVSGWSMIERPPVPTNVCAGIGLTGPSASTPEAAFDAWWGVPKAPPPGWTVDWRDEDSVTFVPPAGPNRLPYQRVSAVRDGRWWSVTGACVSGAVN